MRALQQAREPAVLAVEDLAIEQQREGLFEREAVDGTLGGLFFECSYPFLLG